MDYLVIRLPASAGAMLTRPATSSTQLNDMPNLGVGNFKIGYAATAMPVRYVVERGQWADAAEAWLHRPLQLRRT